MEDSMTASMDRYQVQAHKTAGEIYKLLADGCGTDCGDIRTAEKVAPQNDFAPKDIETNGFPWLWVIASPLILLVSLYALSKIFRNRS